MGLLVGGGGVVLHSYGTLDLGGSGDTIVYVILYVEEPQLMSSLFAFSKKTMSFLQRSDRSNREVVHSSTAARYNRHLDT